MKERVLLNWKTSLAGAASFVSGIAGITMQVYYPLQNAPKALLLIAALAAFITNLLAKDK